MRIYLDNCCYNRPFDEQTQLRVRLETVTKLAVQLLPFLKRRTSILWWKDGATEYVETTEEIIRRGEEIEQLGVKPKDALHLASAEKANCDVFLTTDKGILKKVSVLGQMKIVNPVQFISEEYNENL